MIKHLLRHFEIFSVSLCLCGSAILLRPATAEDLPSLDDLLDLDVPRTQNQPTVEDKPIDPDAVTAQQGRNALERAVGRMQDVATRMGDDRDVSLSLQRQQEEIIKDLDQVIAAAKKQQQQQSSSSSSSSSSQQQQQQNQQNDTKQNSQKRSDATQSNKQSKAASQQQRNQPSANAGDQAASMATQDPGNKAQPMESGKVEWGNLPPRLRDELMQGTQERFSPVYEKQTEAYYRRLAEEAK
ncbi:MAG: hypothetical protein CMJ19_01850 [Phycisphaeraceae bacterium]|nr:hypothetical protein [Phycisphaeraceae bacterium]